MLEVESSVELCVVLDYSLIEVICVGVQVLQNLCVLEVLLLKQSFSSRLQLSSKLPINWNPCQNYHRLLNKRPRNRILLSELAGWNLAEA